MKLSGSHWASVDRSMLSSSQKIVACCWRSLAYMILNYCFAVNVWCVMCIFSISVFALCMHECVCFMRVYVECAYVSVCELLRTFWSPPPLRCLTSETYMHFSLSSQSLGLKSWMLMIQTIEHQCIWDTPVACDSNRKKLSRTQMCPSARQMVTWWPAGGPKECTQVMVWGRLQNSQGWKASSAVVHREVITSGDPWRHYWSALVITSDKVTSWLIMLRLSENVKREIITG